jgi:formate hydrogenlyase subunit 3/multisubunit Na+/H+ antiporter MnhD subunit
LLFGVPLMLQSDAMMQPLAFVLALAMCSTFLVTIARAETPRTRYMATLLALLSANLVALWAANPLTMVIAWAICDLLQMAACIAAGGSPQYGHSVERSFLRGLIFGNLATLLLWCGTLLSGGAGGSELWSLMTPTGAQLALWAAAGILRLWVYPFHLAIPEYGRSTESPLRATSSLAPLLLGPVVGWGLWLRLTLGNGGSLPGSAWLPMLAALTLMLGGFLAWSCSTVHRAPPWVGMAAGGAVLLAASLAGKNAAIAIVAGSTAWVLGITVFFLHDGLRREAPWWSIPTAVGTLALLGFPLTLGFVSQAALLGGLTRRVLLGMGSAFFFGNLFLTPALVRRLLSSPASPLPDRYRQFALLGAGLALPALLLLAAGTYPPLIGGGVAISLATSFASPGLPGWLLWIVSLACGGVLAWQEKNVRPKIELLLNAIHDLLRLEWLYTALVGALDRGLGVLRAADEIVSGAGALLWSVLLFLLILLVWGRR